MSNTVDRPTLERQVVDNYTVYKVDNSWFRAFPDKPDTDSCWATYEKAGKPTTSYLLLGDTKIRSDDALVANFGLSSANGVQEEESRAVAARAQGVRDAAAAGASPAASGSGATAPGLTRMPGLTPMPMAGSSVAPVPVGSAAPPGGAIPVVGSGSILSTRGWSPLLNDCFIMGGVHAGRKFQFALAPEESAIFERLPPAGTPKERWRAFFKENESSFWNLQLGVPRVFARELYGLKAFGYSPAFDDRQLTFSCVNGDAAKDASLLRYCTALHDGMTPEAEKKTLIDYLVKYLFTDSKG